VLLRPRHPYTQALLAVLPDARRTQRPALIAGEPPDSAAIPAGCRFHPRCPRRIALAASGVDVTPCTARELPVLPAAGTDRVACHFADQEPAGSGPAEVGSAPMRRDS
jgi:peptide/nickel transport system ATP-binding protein